MRENERERKMEREKDVRRVSVCFQQERDKGREITNGEPTKYIKSNRLSNVGGSLIFSTTLNRGLYRDSTEVETDYKRTEKHRISMQSKQMKMENKQ